MTEFNARGPFRRHVSENLMMNFARLVFCFFLLLPAVTAANDEGDTSTYRGWIE